MVDISKAVHFLKTDIWRIRIKDLSRTRAFFVETLRIIILTVRGILEDKAHLRASALTFYSLLSIVPILAMAFGFAKGFGLESALEETLAKAFQGQEQIVERAMGFAQALLEDVKGGVVAGIGLVILLWSIIKIISHIENAFNHIWGIEKPRNLGRRIADYLALVIICPALYIFSTAGTVVITSQAEIFIKEIQILGAVSPVLFFFLKFVPYCSFYVLFTFLYMFIPNTKVTLKSGLLGGIIAGTMYAIFQLGYIHLQVGVAKYNAVYGSFAALPLFFIWLQYSWLIVLVGAEISFSYQNAETYEFEQDTLNVSHAFKVLASLMVTHLIVRHFGKREKRWDATQIAKELDLPIRLARQILNDLGDAGVLSEVISEEGTTIGYQPGVDTDAMTIMYVIDAMEHYGSTALPITQSEDHKKIVASLKEFHKLIEESDANHLLKDI
ncbi:MAG: YihY family inner membrane protein [Deltaproteobacteria bacterium]|nr:YihY family inner membrane protein [Deltaproteobacteria bacterium]